MKRSPIKRKRTTPRKVAGRDHGDMGNTWAIVWVRQNGRCALCPGPMVEAHHRQTRRFGPDCPANILGLCRPCHHSVVHAKPAQSLVNGWIVSRHEDRPCRKPVMLDGEAYWLGCDGSRGLCSRDEKQEQEAGDQASAR